MTTYLSKTKEILHEYWFFVFLGVASILGTLVKFDVIPSIVELFRI